MENELQRIREEAQKRLAAMQEESDLVSLQQQLFGKAGELTAILRSMGKLSKEERAQLGANVNKLKHPKPGATAFVCCDILVKGYVLTSFVQMSCQSF